MPTETSTETPTPTSTEAEEATRADSSSDSSSGGGGGGGGGDSSDDDDDGELFDLFGDESSSSTATSTPTATPTQTPAPNSSRVLSSSTNTSNGTLPATNDTVVTTVTAEPQRVSAGERATILVTVKNPQPTADTHTVELELFGSVVDSNKVNVPARGETTVEFAYNIVEPGTHTVRVGSETTNVTVVEAENGTSTTTPSSMTSTQFPGFGPVVVLVSLVLAGLLLTRRG